MGSATIATKTRARGHVRAVGCSCHDFGARQAAAESDGCDVNLMPVNHAAKAVCAGPERVVPLSKGVYGMKVVGGGALAANPEVAIRFAPA